MLVTHSGPSGCIPCPRWSGSLIVVDDGSGAGWGGAALFPASYLSNVDLHTGLDLGSWGMMSKLRMFSSVVAIIVVVGLETAVAQQNPSLVLPPGIKYNFLNCTSQMPGNGTFQFQNPVGAKEYFPELELTIDNLSDWTDNQKIVNSILAMTQSVVEHCVNVLSRGRGQGRISGMSLVMRDNKRRVAVRARNNGRQWETNNSILALIQADQNAARQEQLQQAQIQAHLKQRQDEELKVKDERQKIDQICAQTVNLNGGPRSIFGYAGENYKRRIQDFVANTRPWWQSENPIYAKSKTEERGYMCIQTVTYVRHVTTTNSPIGKIHIARIKIDGLEPKRPFANISREVEIEYSD